MKSIGLVSTLFVTIIVYVPCTVTAERGRQKKEKVESELQLLRYTRTNSESSPLDPNLLRHALFAKISTQEIALQKLRGEVNRARFDAVDAQRQASRVFCLLGYLQQRMEALEFGMQLLEINSQEQAREHRGRVIPLEKAKATLQDVAQGLLTLTNALEGRVSQLEVGREEDMRCSHGSYPSPVNFVEGLSTSNVMWPSVMPPALEKKNSEGAQ